MEYQKITNLLSNTPDQPPTKNWVKINDDSQRTYNTNSQTRFETTILKSSSCDYSDAYILVQRTIALAGQEADVGIQADRRNRQVILKILHRLLTV